MLESGFERFQFCRPSAEVDIENDEFQFQSTSSNGVCITSLNINGKDMVFGPEYQERSSFWIDGNNNVCHRDLTSTSQITFKNGAIDSYECDKCPDAWPVSSMGNVGMPLYLHVEQWDECVGSKPTGLTRPKTVACKPAQQPTACPDATWDDLYGPCGVGTLFDDC